MHIRFLALGALVAACSGTEPGPPQTLTPLTQLPRDLTAGELLTARASNQFTFSMLKRLSATEPGKNVFVSPLSMSFSLGMAMNGASGTTLDEMRATLGFGSADLATINAGFRGLIDLEAGLDPSTTFEIANSVWYRQDFSVQQSFQDAVKEAFYADVRSSPFDATTVTAVNTWVSDKTHGRIETILTEIAPSAVMFLINAIYFKGSWQEQFPVSSTQTGTFNAVDGPQSVPMMRRKTIIMPYASDTTATIGELVYGNSAFVMTVVEPVGDIDAWVASLDTAAWSSLLGKLNDFAVPVTLPKFKFAYERLLNEDLKALGMVVPFSAQDADFSGINPSEQLFISFVKHKAFVDVNEEGTEAAAVTVAGVATSGSGPCLCVNSPFLFVIRERFSGTILFVGKIVRIP